MLDSSSPPGWLRPASLRWVDASAEYHGLASTRSPSVQGTPVRTPEWSQAWSDVVHSQRTLEALRDAGITAITVHFDGGFGPSAQAEEFRHAARFARSCREHGLRVFAKVEAGALFYETLLADQPGLAAWAQRDAGGTIIPTGDGRPAWRPCYRSRGFLEMLKDSISQACEHLEADGVVIAHLGPHSCHCERCQRAFRALLASRHPNPGETLGLPTLQHTRLPAASSPEDPLSREAAYFEVHALRTALAELRIHARSRSAQVALWAEAQLGGNARSRAAAWELSAPADVLTPPGGGDSRGGGRLQETIRALLAGQATHTMVCMGPTEAEGTPPQLTEMALALAFGGHVLASHGATRPAQSRSGSEASRFVAEDWYHGDWRAYLDFIARHEHYYHRAESLTEVALLFSLADIAAGEADAEAVDSAERALLETGIPFDMEPIGRADASGHQVLVVAGQSHMSVAEGETLCKLAREGRKLVVVGDAGTCDTLGRLRRVPLLEELRDEAGVAFVADTEGPPEDSRARAADAVKAALPASPVVETTGVEGAQGIVAVRPFRLPTGQAAFHVLNCGGTRLEGVRLRIRGDLAPTGHVAWHCPGSTDRMLDCATDGRSVITALPPLDTYALVVTS